MLASVQGLPSLTILSTIDVDFDLEIQGPNGLSEGLGIGVMIPRTDATILGRERHDKFHLSGYGISGMAGINFNFLNHFFIQTEYKAGYINMQDIKTGFTDADNGQQHFFFGQYNLLFGYIF